MKKSIMFRILPIVSILIALAGCSQNNQKPNIILIMTDDQGYGDLSANGSPDVSTPHIDQLRSQGIRLEDFLVSPTCAPTRSAIMSGRHPFKAGVTHTILERERMATGITTLPEVLKRGDYTTGIFGKWHLGDEPEYQPDSRGFDEVFIHGAGGIGQSFPGSCADVPDNDYFDPVIKHNGNFVKTSGFCTDVFFAQALSWIKTNAEEGKPFFAYISTNAPHGPFIAPDEYKEKFVQKDYPSVSQGFYGMVENIDDNMGLLMEKLDEWNISQNTILIFMTDNGKTGAINQAENGKAYNAGMKGFKNSNNEGGTRVPFYMRWPKALKAGYQVDAMLNHYDLLPTFADIADIDISDIDHLDGRSFLPYLIDEVYEGEDRYRFFHCGRWRLNPNNLPPEFEGARHTDGTEESSNPENYKHKRCAVRNERFRLVDHEKLYDLFNDPGQKTDVAAEYPEIVAQMQKAYDDWWESVRPFMVNENVLLAEERPYWVEYYEQEESTGIKDWVVPNID